jgi:hypothetical protein
MPHTRESPRGEAPIYAIRITIASAGNDRVPGNDSQAHAACLSARTLPVVRQLANPVTGPAPGLTAAAQHAMNDMPSIAVFGKIAATVLAAYVPGSHCAPA